MRLAKISLAIITSLALMFSVCLPVQANEENDSVDLSATVALAISNVSASSISRSGATISWKTNGDATSQVFYDTVYHEDVDDYAHHTEDTALVSEHNIRLTGLSSGRTYHYRVRSAIPDTEFIDTSEEDYTFRTSSPAPSPPTPPVTEPTPEEPQPEEPEEPEFVEPEPEVVEPEEEPIPPEEEEPEVIEPEEEPEVVEPEEEEELIPYVLPAKPGTPWGLIGGLAGGLAAAGGIGYWLWRRRRKEANDGS